jgi:hypothetical protein
MLMSVAELRQFVDIEEDDRLLETRLQALELSIRAYTNNNFQRTSYRRDADIIGGLFLVEALTPFGEGDTVQISGSRFNDGLYTVAEASDSTFTVVEDVTDEENVLVTKVVYPADVKMGAVNLLKWELNNREKVGVSSETISRHSVTYFDMNGDNSVMGYPRALLGFLRPYKKARFGQGLNA